MSKEWLWWLGEFGLAAVVAIVAGFITGDVPISILYGLFVGTVFFVLRQNSRVTSRFDRQVTEMEDKTLNLPKTLSNIYEVDPFLSRVIRTERDNLLRLSREAADGTIVIKPRPILNIAFEMSQLARPGDRIFAVNLGIGWGTPQYELLRKLNFEQVEKGIDFVRVFIESAAATTEDNKRLRQEMDRQKDRLHIRFIKEADVPPDMRVNAHHILGRYALYAHISKPVGSGISQIWEDLRISTEPAELKKAEEMADTLIKLSEEYK